MFIVRGLGFPVRGSQVQGCDDWETCLKSRSRAQTFQNVEASSGA